LQSPDYAHVANALGAVVGSIRQEQVVFINSAGGKRVLVMLPEGPLEIDTLDAGAQIAILHASRLAREKALRAGANDVTLGVDRDDTVVKQGDDDIFFESRITVTASGRPAI
jgi:S-adenosylmethionine:diacylglycerol 3-amino-3-carboxypropyl transferase